MTLIFFPAALPARCRSILSRSPRSILLGALTLLFVGVALAAPEDELLEPDKAFALTTRVVDGKTLEASWKIAPGYYMYRDKFQFEIIGGRAVLKPAVLPTGKIKSDPLFGNVETYTDKVTARLPLDRPEPGAQTLKLRIVGQGCNEPIGVCYPPIKKEISFALPALAAAPAISTTTSATGGIRSLKDLARALDAPRGSDEPLHPDLAFKLLVEPHAQGALVRFAIDECCYLYRDKTKFELVRSAGALPAGAKLGPYSLPAGQTKDDQYVGKTEVYTKGLVVPVALQGLDANTDVALKVHYQGCAEKPVSICYPPASKDFPLAAVIAASASAAPPPTAAVAQATTGVPAPRKVERDTRAFALTVLAAFGIGLLLTFTPCVLPMIPILSSVIVGSSDRHITKLEGGMLSIIYVFGTTVTYTIAGIVAGATGDQLQAYFQNPWALGTFAVILGLLSLSMFGFYELQIPSFIQSHLHKQSTGVHSRFKHLKGGAFVGVFIMGLVSALIVGACVSPLLISALGVAIANRDPLLGGATMFSMALGMGVVLIAIGFGAGFLLPKAGKWMESVKHVFGVLLLGVAIYLLGYLPQVPVLFLWAALFIITGVYMGATQSLPQGARGWLYFNKGLGTFLVVWGVLALLGGFAGNRDILNPLPLNFSGSGVAVTSGAVPSTAAPLFEPVRNLGELDSKLAQAKAAGKPVILDYFATWCTDCIRMEKSTFLDPQVRAEMSRFMRLQVDVTDPTDQDTRAIKQRYGVFGPPALLLFAVDGAERRELRTYGYKDSEAFIALLRKV